MENIDNVYESIKIEKFINGKKIKFMSFTTKVSEKSDLTQLVTNLLITIAEKHGYAKYFNSSALDDLIESQDSFLLNFLDELTSSIITPPLNDMQNGFNIAIESIIAKIEIRLGMTTTSTFQELIDKIKSQ